jgi:sporulation protein YlmC with PRC-barrel domain
MDLGPPLSYLALEESVPVYTRDGRQLGKVEHVLADDASDVFDGLVVATSGGPGGKRFVDASQVERIHERGVVLTLDAAAAETLPEPSENPPAMGANPADVEGGELQRKLRRAWDRISGNY